MEATFQPAVSPSFIPDSAAAGIEQGQSMMQRASNLRQSQQMEQMRAQQLAEEQVMLPVKVAAAQAQITQAHSAISAATRMQTFRTQAAAAAPQANNEFLDAIQIADWDAQSAELSRIQAKYSFMGQIPEYQGFLKTVDEARANAVTRALTDQKLEQAQEVARMTVEGRIQTAETAAAVRPEVAKINAGARVEAATVGAEGRKEVATATHDASMDRTEVRALNVAAVEADKEALKYDQAGEDTKAAAARRTAENFRAQAKEKATKPTPDNFSIPNVTNKAKLYVPPTDGQAPTFTPAVKTPDDVLAAMQQMVNDDVITVDQARETLTKLGFKKKGE